MRNDEVDARRFIVAHGREGVRIEVVADGRMSDVEGIVLIDVSVGILGKVVEDVSLQRVGRLHDEGIEIQPPKPEIVSKRTV